MNKEMTAAEYINAVSEIISPADGLITGINEQINENPSVVNTDPYNEGWMVKIKLDNKFDRSSFLSDSEYKELIGI